MEKKYLEWKSGFSKTKDQEPLEWIAARVPGSAQLDHAEAHQYPSYLKSLNFEKFKWMEDVFWKYQAPLQFELAENEKAYLHFDGIDYRYEIRVDNEVLLCSEGMFSPVHLDVTRFSGEKHILTVIIAPVPKADDSDCRDQARNSVKSAACYGWDWHPRLVTSGIWDEAYLLIENAFNAETLDLSYRLSENLKKASVQLEAKTSADGPLRYQILDPDGKTVLEGNALAENGCFKASFVLENVSLWYPVGYGEQPLYRVILNTLSPEGRVLSEKTRKVGFKRTRLVMNEGSWIEPALFPKSRSDAPATLSVNGQRIFARGSNLVCTRLFPGEMTKEIYDRLLTLVKDANMNILRIWGGGFINKESFYELCDEKGILIWQEFPLACNEYPDDPAYIDVLEKEAVSIVRRLRTHPCLAFWCGGNELFNVWSKMTDQHHALRLLDSITFKEDRDTPFIMTSPLNGMAHGCYCNYDPKTKEESMQMFARSHNTAYTEFGCSCVADQETLRNMMTEEEFENLKPGDPIWIAHRNFSEWQPEQAIMSDVDYFFGGYTDMADLSEKGEFLQAMCYRSNFEEMRRQWPHCAMALNWCFNEVWPLVGGLALIAYPDKPRPSYYAVQKALRPRIASLKVPRQVFYTGEEFTGEVYLINDTLQAMEASTVSAYLILGNEKKHLGDFCFEELQAQKVVKLGAVSKLLPDCGESFVKLLLEVEGHSEMDSEYTYVLRSPKQGYVPGTFLNN